jgi:4-hydroxy-3-polyprenylbenzoate decarboxylase
VKRLVIGLSGASGVIYGIRLLQVLRRVEGIETHLVMTPAAKRTVLLETDYAVDQVEALADRVFACQDIAAPIASGSFRVSGMVVAPCTVKTLSGIAQCSNQNLLLRAADVVLKERKPLVLMLRESPLHLGHVRLMVRAIEMGAIMAPPVPAFYHRPKSLDDVVDQTVNRTLDQLGLELDQDLFERWEGDRAAAPATTSED